MARFDTLHALLAANAREDRQIHFIDGEDEQRVMSFERLRRRATGLLGALQRMALQPGHAVLIAVADNERFLEMFWACVLGGLVPVTLAPVTTDEQRRKLLAVFSQFDHASVLIDTAALERLEGFAAAHDLHDAARRLAAAALAPGRLDAAGEPGQPAAVRPDDLAFVQYSSGSTGTPKGVMLTHRNLCANIASIAQAAAFTDRDVALSWMPLSHDMGLIGFHLNMLACGVAHALMRTELFARRPLMWMEQASRRRATVLCSPNFGYQHYLRQHDLKHPQGLDLSAVRLVFNGAEPISAELCRRFQATMTAHGLAANTLFPVYGLAEASLAVSFPVPGAPLRTIALRRGSLRIGESPQVAAPQAHEAVEFVLLGRPVPGTELRIVDESGGVLGERRLGHVQIRGDNVTCGYFRDAERSAALIDTQGWLQTGDLGLLWDGQLVITGRAKDLVIVNGQNHYPHDLERIAETVEGIQAQRVAAVGVRRAAGEELALFVLHRGELSDFVVKARELRRVLLEQTGIEATYVVPVGHIPKTTSGKLQRYALADAFEKGEYDAALAELARIKLEVDSTNGAAESVSTTTRRLLDACGPLVPERRLTSETNLLEIDLNSLTLARIHEAIEREFPRRIDVTDLFDYPTLGSLAEYLDAAPG